MLNVTSVGEENDRLFSPNPDGNHFCYFRANGAKRSSGHKPGTRVTNRALVKSKEGSSRKDGHYVIFSEGAAARKKHFKNKANDQE